MRSGSLDVLALGNAIVDVLVHAGDEFLDRHGLAKGSMALVEWEESEKLYGDMGPGVEMSGGSAANTAVGVASFGGAAGFIGKVRDDQLGEVFTHDIRAAGVRYETTPARGGASTARSLIVVTPDAQRTMNTYLGVAAEVTVDDVDEELVASASVMFVEGYLIGVPVTHAALDKAVACAGKVALTLSDAFWVGNQREAFVKLLPRIDVLFANEAEALALWQTDDVEEALARTADAVPMAAVTRHEHGSVVLVDGTRYEVTAEPVAQVVDTTGAGDLYASGFLYGLTHGADPAGCGRLGSIAAAEVISHIGARPQRPLSELVGNG